MRPKVIASLAYPDSSRLPADGAQRVAAADIVEVRLDAVEGGPEEAVRVCRTVAEWGRPLLLTPRAAGEGGERSWDDAARRATLEAVWATGVDAPYTDVEVRESPRLLEWLIQSRPEGSEVIASFHDFRRFPGEAELDVLALEASAKGADRFKVAVAVDSLDEAGRLACWTRDRSRSQAVISMALGEAGSLSRVMNGAFGSWASYGHIDRATAPGQLAVAELAPLLDRFYPVDS